jgi:hypothetical protein
MAHRLNLSLFNEVVSAEEIMYPIKMYVKMIMNSVKVRISKETSRLCYSN